MLRVFAAFFLVCLHACSTQTKPVRQDVYFDNPAWFKEEIGRKQKQNPELIKNLQVDKDTSHLTIRPESWEKELEVFLETDLNKAVYSGKFKTDTIRSGAGAQDSLTIRYTAKEEDINVRYYSVVLVQNRVRNLQAEILNTSPLLRSELKWSYWPDSGYSVQGSHEMKGIRSKHFLVNARYRF